MPLKDKRKRNEYQKNLMRRRRAEAKGGSPEALEYYADAKLKTAEDLKRIVDEALEVLKDAKAKTINDTIRKTQTIASVAKVAADLLERTDTERRLQELEAVVSERHD